MKILPIASFGVSLILGWCVSGYILGGLRTALSATIATTIYFVVAYFIDKKLSIEQCTSARIIEKQDRSSFFSNLSSLSWYFLLIVVSAAICFWGFLNGQLQLDTTSVFGDTPYSYMHAKAIIDEGWWLYANRLGFPEGIPFSILPMDGHITYIIWWGLSFFTNDPVYLVHVSIFFYTTLAALAYFFCLGALRMERHVAFSFALVFAFMPEVYRRFPAHPHTLNYSTPIAVTVAILISTGKWFDFSKSMKRVFLLLVFVSGFASQYNSFFTSFILFCSIIIGLISRTFKFHQIRQAVLPNALLLCAFIVNTMPLLWTSYTHPEIMIGGSAPYVKSVMEADVYALRIRDLLRPVNNGVVEIFDDLDLKIRNANFPFAATESEVSRLGILGSLGFLILLTLACVKHIKMIPEFSAMASLTLCCIFLGISGGFGSLFNLFISPAIRAYTRLSLIIGFFSLTTLALCLSLFYNRYINRSFRHLIFMCFLTWMTSGAIVTQWVPRNDFFTQNSAQRIKTTTLLNDIDDKLPKEAKIFYLRSEYFPHGAPFEKFFLDRRIYRNEIFPYLLTGKYFWSTFPAYPSAVDWQRIAWMNAVPGGDIRYMINVLKSKGFDAIWLDHRTLQDGGKYFLDSLLKIDNINRVIGNSPELYTVVDIRNIPESLNKANEEASYRLYFSKEKFNLDRICLSVKGMSGVEAWGSWSNDHTVVFDFPLPLPTNFSLRLFGRAFGNNVGKEFLVEVNGHQNSFSIGSKDEEVLLDFKGVEDCREIIIHIPEPCSPKSLGVNSDTRMLGLGLVEMSITPIEE